MGDSPKLHSTHPDKPLIYSNKIRRTSTRALREAAGRAEGGKQSSAAPGPLHNALPTGNAAPEL